MGKIKQKTVEVVSKRKLFQTTDGREFTNREAADAHQYRVDHVVVDVNIPVEVRLKDFVAWAEALLLEHGPKAMFVQNYNCMDAEFQIVKKR